MTMMDKDIAMQNSHASYVTVGPFTTGTTNQLCGVNEKRIGLIIANCAAAQAAISPDNPTMTAGIGINLPTASSGNSWIALNLWDHGTIVRKAWSGIIAAANWKMFVIEIIADDCNAPELPGSPGPGY